MKIYCINRINLYFSITCRAKRNVFLQPIWRMKNKTKQQQQQQWRQNPNKKQKQKKPHKYSAVWKVGGLFSFVLLYF